MGLVYLLTMARIERILRAAFFLESDPLAWKDWARETSMNKVEKSRQETVIVNIFLVILVSIFLYWFWLWEKFSYEKKVSGGKKMRMSNEAGDGPVMIPFIL